MKQYYLWIAIAVLLLLGFLFFYVFKQPYSGTTPQLAPELIPKAEDFGVRVDIKAINPLGDVQDVNPVEKANPFSNTYQNPFE